MSFFGFLLTLCWYFAQFSQQVQAAATCLQQPIDVVFLIDGSRSVRAQNFEIVKDYVKNFTKTFSEIGPNATQIGVIQFASSIREEIYLGQYSNHENLLQAIDDISYMRMGTMTGEALRYLVTHALQPSRGSRLTQKKVRTVALVITDGKSQDYHRGTFTRWQRKAKELGVEFYGIGVGQRSNQRELLEIASKPKAEHKFHTDDFNGIQSIALQLRGLNFCYSTKIPSLILSNATLSTITANWSSAENQNFTGYSLKYYRVDDSCTEEECKEIITHVLGPNISKYVLTELDPDSLYNVTLHPMFGNKVLGQSDVEMRTASLTRPVVEVVDENITSIGLRWSHDNIAVSSWTVSYHPKGKRRQITALGVSGEKNSVVITRLSPSTLYKFEVTGNVEEFGNEFVTPSGRARGRTEPLLPPSIKCMEASNSSINMSIDDVSNEATYVKIDVFRENNPENSEHSISLNVQQRFFFLDKLLPGTTYIVMATSVISEDPMTSHSSENTSQTCTTVPNPPRNLHLSDSELNSLTFEFDPPVGGFDSFVGQCRAIDDASETIRAAATIDFRMKCVGLQPSTQYEVQLATIYRNLTSNQVSTIEATLTPPPSELSLTNITTHSLIATWMPPESLDVEFYYITFNFSDENVDVKTVKGNETSTAIDHLEPDTYYSVQVQAFIGNEESYAAQASARTKPDILGLKIDSVGYTSINVSWTPSSVPHIESYCLKYTPAYLPTFDHNLVLPTDVDSYQLNDLETATRYKISLNGHYAATQSEEIEKYVATLALPPIGPLNFTELSDSSFVASWLPPATNPDPVGYIVTYTPTDGPSSTIEGVNNTYLLIDDLDPETVYDVTVQACYPDDLISQSINGNTFTLSSPPSACSCSTYLEAQSQMQVLMKQMMGQIVLLNSKVEGFRKVSKRKKNRKILKRRRNKKKSRKQKHKNLNL